MVGTIRWLEFDATECPCASPDLVEEIRVGSGHDGIREDLADLRLHRPSVFSRPDLQAVPHLVVEITHAHIGHEVLARHSAVC